MREPRDVVRGAATIGAAVAAIVVGVVGSHLSLAIFVAAAAALAVVVAYGSLTWPRPALVVVALTPILDRYLAPGVIDPRAETLAHFLSEGLLLVVGAVLVAQAVQRGTLVRALWHPTTVLLAVFGLVAVASAFLNAVSPTQALAGIIFTVDAVAFFFLARIVGFTDRQAIRAIGAFVVLMLLASIVAVLQALLSPNLFGLFALQGKFGEVYRLASFFGDPNVFATLLSAAVPFLLFGLRGQPTRQRTVLMLLATCVMLMALLLSFSRGGWFGAIVGFGIAGLLLDRRALLTGAVLTAAMFLVVTVMPRDLLGGSGDRPDLLDSTFGRIGAVGEGRDLRTLFIGNAVPIIRDHPLIGVGPGRYGGAVAELYGTEVYAEYGTDKLLVDPKQHTIDNFWLHLLGETGFIGLFAFVGMVGVPLLAILRAVRAAAWRRRVLLSGIAAAVMALVVNSTTTMLLEANSVAFLFWLMLGMGSLLAVGEDSP